MILAAPAGFWTDFTSINELLPLRKEGEWSTGSTVHDATYATGACWRLEAGVLVRGRVRESDADNAWAEAHRAKRFTARAGKTLTLIHLAGLRAGSSGPWHKYRRDETRPEHAARVAALTDAAEAAVRLLLSAGPGALEDARGFALLPRP
jgi:hypothetical protein